MGELRSRQIYLIRKFVLVMVLVSIVEYFVISFINRLIMPIIFRMFFKTSDVVEIGFFGVVFLFLFLLVNLISELIAFLLPGKNTLLTAGFSRIFGRLAVGINLIDGSILSSNIYMRIILFVILVVIMILIIFPFLVASSFIVGVVVKEFKKIEEADEKKRREYDRKRNLMLSDIAHDLRTPMTTVSGYAKALSDNMVSDDKKEEYLNAIRNKTERMDELITFLFEYVKTDSEGFTLNKEKIDICETVRECGAFYYQDIEDNGSELEADIPEEVCMINADKLQLSRVINNLLTNALRHNKKGTNIGLFVIKETDEIKICVCDNGDLIDKEKAEHIFEPFFTLDEARGSNNGTGLGLSIAENIIKMHGYKIKLIQKPDISKIKEIEAYNKAFVIRIPYQED